SPSIHEETALQDASVVGMDQVLTKGLDQDHCVAVWRHLIIVCWGISTTVEGVASFDRATREHAVRCPEGRVLMMLFPERAKPLPPMQRERLARSMRRLDGSVERSAVIIAGEAFAKAMALGVVADLNRMSRPRFEHRVFENLELAADWLALGP